MTELLYKDEVFQIIGAAIEVYNRLGSGFLEGVYQDALAVELGIRGIPFVEQAPFTIVYKNQPLKHCYVADMVAFEKIIIELKAVSTLSPWEDAQTINYLKVANLRLGLLINFGRKHKLEWKRLVY